MNSISKHQHANSASFYDIAYSSVHDGPGSRVVLFFQGCNAKCVWCHSPHSQPNQSPILFNEALCSQCGRCEQACENFAHQLEESLHHVERRHCQGCGKCVEACPNSFPYRKVGALNLPTETVEVGNLYQRLLPHLQTCSGITLSGGEALLQYQAAYELLALCKQDGIHTAVETSGLLPDKHYQNLQGLVDCWLFGMRFTTNYPEKDHTGKINRSFDQITKYNSEILPRIPVVPGHTDTAWYLNRCLALLERHAIRKVMLNPWNISADHNYRLSGAQLKMKMPSSQQAQQSQKTISDFFKRNAVSLVS